MKKRTIIIILIILFAVIVYFLFNHLKKDTTQKMTNTAGQELDIQTGKIILTEEKKAEQDRKFNERL